MTVLSPILSVRSRLLRGVVVAVALVAGPAALAPGVADTPRTSAIDEAQRSSGGRTSAQSYGWGRMLWDFAWEFGESIGSRPYRGADIGAGRWVERSNGTGRVAKYGGGVEFHSALVRKGTAEPDFGDTRLLLQDQPTRRGRWEVSARSFRHETSGRDYTFLVELVPADPDAYDCGAHNLTVARFSPGGDELTVGVNAGTAAWSRTFGGHRQDGNPHTFAVEVRDRRITWFSDGRSIASLGARAAVPRVPLTVRMSLVGDGTAEMKKAVVKVDWVRGYDLERGRTAPKGAALSRRTYGDAC